MTLAAALLLALHAGAALPRVPPLSRPGGARMNTATRLWTSVPGSSRVRVGSKLVDTRAPGARELLRSLELPHRPPVLGFFEVERARVINGMAQDLVEVKGHEDMLPPQLDARAHGGYGYKLYPDGEVRIAGSGSFFKHITPRVERTLHRYFGVSPADEKPARRIGRTLRGFWDGVSGFAP